MISKTSETHSPLSRSRVPLRFLLPVFALIAAALLAYFKSFFNLNSFDDEGYLLATVKAFVEHHALYDQIYTLYGPFYYLVEWLFYGVTGFAPSHDCVRLIAFVLWSFCAAMLSWPVYHMTRSLLLSGFTLVVAVQTLVFFQWSPGHPEEICLALLACLLVLLCGVSGEISKRRMLAFAILAAAIAQTKINLGLYVSLAILLSLLLTLSKGRSRTIMLAATGMLSVVLIAGIMSSLFRFSWVRDYFCLFLIAFSTVLIGAFFMRLDAVISRNSWYVLILAYVLTYTAILVPFLLRGTTIWGFFYATIWQHRNFTKHWFRASAFGAGTLFWSACSLLLFAAWLLKFAKHQRFLLALQWLKGILGACAAFQLLIHRANWPICPIIMSFIAPFTWLILIEPVSKGIDPKQFGRVALALISVFVNLYAFPVAGSQDLFAIIPMISVIALFLHDAVAEISVRNWIVLSSRVWRTAAIGASILIAASYVRELSRSYLEYSRNAPSPLPGSTHIHVSPEQASTFQWLTQEVDNRCPSFFSMPGLFSFYFWTRQTSPTLMMMNDWPGFLDQSQQEIVVRDLVKLSTTCIVYNPSLIKLFHAENLLPSSPLAQYIQSNFVTTDQRAGYELMVRKQATGDSTAHRTGGVERANK